MMALPVELADESMDSPKSHSDEALTETTHANFLSLVRALFPAKSAHRASKRELQARCMAVMRSPIAPLNTWYNCKYWCNINMQLYYLIFNTLSQKVTSCIALRHIMALVTKL